MKRLTSICLLIVLTFGLFSCGTPKKKRFEAEGMSLVLTDEFKKQSYPGYTVCYESKRVAVFALKEPFSEAEGAEALSLRDYAVLVRASNITKSPSEIKEEEGLTVMEYTFRNEAEGKTFRYFCTMFKGADAFWLVQFACLESEYASRRPTFVKWAKTVTLAP